MNKLSCLSKLFLSIQIYNTLLVLILQEAFE